MGTQRGRPVEGAAALTEGMRAQQALTAELERARAAREVSDNDVAEVRRVLQRPATPEEIEALPSEQRNAWMDMDALQGQLDELRGRIADTPRTVLDRPNPERAELEEAARMLQRRLDNAQEALVMQARKVFEAKREGRRRRIQAVRSLLQVKDLDASTARELRIRLNELRVQRAQRGTLSREDSRTPQQVEWELRNKSAKEVLDWLVETAPNPALKAIAQGVRATTTRLANFGYEFDFRMVDLDAPVPDSVRDELDAGAIAVTHIQGLRVTVFVNSTAHGEFAGTDYSTVMHEFVHAATIPYLTLATNPRARGTRTAKLGQDLREVLHAVREHIQSRISSGEALHPVEQAVADDAANVLDNEYELLAWTLSSPEVMEYLDGVPYREGRRSLFTWFRDVVRRIFGLSAKHDSALGEVLRVGNHLLYTSDQEIARLVRSDPPASPERADAVRRVRRMVSKGLLKAQLSNFATGFTKGLDEATEGVKLEAEERRKAFLEGVRSSTVTPALLAVQPTSWVQDAIAAIRPPLGNIVMDIAELEENARGMRTSMERAMRRLVSKVEKFVNTHGQLELASVMTIVRVNQVDVTAFSSLADALANDPVMKHYAANNQPRRASIRQQQIKEAWAAWEKLGELPGGHEIYKLIRQFYKDMYASTRAALDDNIRNLGLDPELTERLIKRSRGEFDEDAVMKDGPHKGLPMKLFPKEYFPFMRFGKYALLVKFNRGDEGMRFQFHSAQARNEFEAKLAKEYGIERGTEEYNQAFKRLDGLESQRDNHSKENLFLAQLFKAVDNLSLPDQADPTQLADYRDSLKDQLYQTYLLTLPERNLRRQFIHARLIAGQSADVLRVFRVSTAQYASQLPKTVYSPLIQRKVEAAYDLANEGDPAESAQLRAMLDVIVSRTRDALSPPQRSMWEQALNDFTFLNLMSAVASALVQPFSVVQSAARMVARYNPVSAFKVLYGYTPLLSVVDTVRDVDPVTGEVTLVPPSIGNTAYIKNNPLRARLWKELDQKRDLFSQKLVDMMLRDRATYGTTASDRLSRLGYRFDVLVVRSGTLFSALDQLTREISGMAFAELEYERLRKAGVSHETAIRRAVNAAVRNTNETIGNYTEVEKPDVFRGDALRRMIGYLRTYSVQRTAAYFRLLKGVVGKDPRQSPRQAMVELSGVLLMTSLLAGVSGAFGYELLTDTIDMLLPYMLGEDEMEKWRREDPLAASSSDYWFRFRWLPAQFGSDSTITRLMQRGVLSEMTGWDWATRLSQSSLWLRNAPKGDTTSETVLNFIGANLSPQVSNISNMLNGITEFAEGNWSKGVEKMLPAGVRGLLTASRLAEEGETTRKGMQVLPAESFSTAELVGQALGFVPKELSEVREQNRFTRAWQDAMTEERGKLITAMREALTDPETPTEEVYSLIEEIRMFNSMVPLDASGQPLTKYLITEDTIRRSVKGREQREDRSVYGLTYGEGEYEALNP